MLKKLSNSEHKVITAVGFLTINHWECIHEITKVKFGKISNNEIIKYTEKDNPFDKAGGYGIQDWFGLIAVENIKGSYTNVVGLPVYKVFHKIKEIIFKY